MTGSSELTLENAKEDIDLATFSQILEMDDDENYREFSHAIVSGFFEQAEQTFVQIQKLIEAKDLAQLSSLGHFLKGSSATLGLIKVKDSCGKIQNYGAMRNDSDTGNITAQQALKNIEDTLKQMKVDYEKVNALLKKFYE